MTPQTAIQTAYRLCPRSFTVLYWTERSVWGPRVARLRCAECGGNLLIVPPTALPGCLQCFDCSREYGKIQTRRPPVVDFTRGEQPAQARRRVSRPRGPAYVSQATRLLALLMVGNPLPVPRLTSAIGCDAKQLRRNVTILRRQGHDIRCASRHYVLIPPKEVGV